MFRLKYLLLIAFFVLSSIQVYSQNAELKVDSIGKIGLSLSGGGAKGLAHIGILHYIDSAGLKIDYISGTSMGSIVGAMYAVGYSAKEIEEFAISIDWDYMLSKPTELNYVHIRNRESAQKNIIELPFEDGKILLPSGAIEGQALRNTLQEVFFHVRHIQDFSCFRIPFSCVATDIETGDQHIMTNGDIVSALRASMAIPAVFTSVHRDGKKLVDGGVVNNFPVDVVQEMGAEYIIGVYVSQGLRPAEKLVTPLDVIYQMGFFLDAQRLTKNKKMCNVFIQPKVDWFSSSSFSWAPEIIQRGKEAAREFYPHFVELAKAQKNNSQTDTVLLDSSMAKRDFLIIDSISYFGLEKIKSEYISMVVYLKKGDTVNVKDLTNIVNRLYSTSYFNEISYNFIAVDTCAERVRLVFSFIEKPFAKLATAINFNSFYGLGLVGEISTNKLFVYNLYANAKLRIGENPALYGGLDFFTNEKQKTWINLNVKAEKFDFNIFEDFQAINKYNQTFLQIQSYINKQLGYNSYYNLGIEYFYNHIKPKMKSDIMVKGYNKAWSLNANLKKYSLNRHSFPLYGQNISLNTKYIFNQKPNIEILNSDNEVISLKDYGININNFLQLKFDFSNYWQINNKLTSGLNVQFGYYYNNEQDFLHAFNVGGTNLILRDQMLFAGLTEYNVLTHSFFSTSMKWQYNLLGQFYFTPILNAAMFDFDVVNMEDLTKEQLLFGLGLDFGFLSSVGPLSATFSYSPQVSKVFGYINLGWNF